ncbi:lytic transglycosylase domain-containing protein [Bradymonas sediminis]|uniref:Lytic transglycosylase domain-containing protein n=1 Tax=Bradymonas sediminis TaxID=1548548 RepID=A0A2Z4FM11_9DELT|nr:lytic transglycosylase domain-containing protein [Bradymonas sediminis]AWV90001.1 lytic transglycosylase domain-containing protein [Bradymonas sediminis]TDP76044.1 transglycosylase-like protein with SLT domain [Bradymonas sediminis]
MIDAQKMGKQRQTRPKRRYFIAALMVLITTFALPSAAFAALYRYEAPDGTTLITTEKKGAGYKLLEVLSGPSPKASKPRPAAKPTSKRSNASTSQKSSAPKAAFKSSGSTRRGEHGFNDIIAEASEAYDVPYAFIKAVIRIESAFRPDAVSPVGAMGLMQLMPRTAASLNVTDAYDPRQNIYGGAKFLRILIDRYDGDINLILAAYNAGDVAVKRYGGIPYPQTRDYVASVYYWYKIYEKEQESR